MYNANVRYAQNAQDDASSSKAGPSPAKPPPKSPKSSAKARKRSSPTDTKPSKRQRVSKKAISDEDKDDEDASEPEKFQRKSSGNSRGKAKTTAQSLSSDLSDLTDSGELANSETKSSKKVEVSKPKPSLKEQKPLLADKADAASESELSEVIDDELEPQRQKIEIKAAKKKQDEASESELSEPIDDEPKPKRKKRGSGPSEPKPKGAPRKPRQKKDKSPDLDPDAEEIKRLQSWLIKCGIRKMWGRELKPYETPKAKIRHLREMLSDAGMTGRFSAEKASQIREARELQADLKAVQEGAKHWGKSDEEEEKEEEEEQPKPRRRLAKGLEGLDFLNDDDGEETD